MPHGVQCWRVRGACCPSLIWVVVEGIHRHRNVLFQLDVHWNVPGWPECFTENRPCKQVCTRTSVSRACLAHGLQCLHVRGACCPSLAKQLVILSFFEVSTGTVICCCNSMCTGMYRVGLNVALTNKPCKQVRARTPVSRACVAHGLQCLCVRGACCPSLAKQLVIL